MHIAKLGIVSTLFNNSDIDRKPAPAKGFRLAALYIMRISGMGKAERFAAWCGAANAMMTLIPLDLFGEIPVTWDEVHIWCEKVAGMTGWRRDWYIRHWNVIEKVRRAKAEGSFYETIAAINSPHAAAIYPQQTVSGIFRDRF